MNCVIIADDLTGACDTALQFRRRGAHALVHIEWNAAPEQFTEVDAFSTDSRNLEQLEAERRIRELAQHVRQAGEPKMLIFKKIDSLLRGNPGCEIMTTLDAFGCDAGIITPGFPEMGRMVLDGYLHVHGDDTWKPVHVLELLQSQGLGECRHVSPGLIENVLKHGAEYISVDCGSPEDLRAIVTEAMRSNRRILWVGSAGLASALASVLYSETIRRADRPRGKRPVLFCIGSQHPVTAVQLETLRRDRGTYEADASSATRAELASWLELGKHVVVRVDAAASDTVRIRELFSGIAALVEAVVISGGDTASLFCRAMQCEIIEIEDQVIEGVPWGLLRGGRADGLTIATKSGAFGAPDSLTKVTDFFACLRK